jgi:DDE superfamily endonuclease
MLLDVSIETSRRSLETSRPRIISADISHAGHCKVLVRMPLVTRTQYYGNYIAMKGSPLPHVIDFIDNSAVEIARPRGVHQRATYSGHKWRNCIKFQAVSAPTILILHIFGPVEGRRHDMALHRESEIDAAQQNSITIDGTQHYLYGDLAYFLRPYLHVGYQGSNVSLEQSLCNAEMSKVRIAVEWTFGEMSNCTLPMSLYRGN